MFLCKSLGSRPVGLYFASLEPCCPSCSDKSELDIALPPFYDILTLSHLSPGMFTLQVIPTPPVDSFISQQCFFPTLEMTSFNLQTDGGKTNSSRLKRHCFCKTPHLSGESRAFFSRSYQYHVNMTVSALALFPTVK